MRMNNRKKLFIIVYCLLITAIFSDAFSQQGKIPTPESTHPAPTVAPEPTAEPTAEKEPIAPPTVAPEPIAPPPEPPTEPLPSLEVIPNEGFETVMATPHFALWEYACDCDGDCDGFPETMDKRLLERIEFMRIRLGVPVIITSGLRCEARNKAVGGIPGSWHLSGHAADLYVPGVDIDTVKNIAEDLGLGVLCYYDRGFMHCELWL
ncbi:MAG: D-Ala-D-Ala carboxypeptidase family metallohydrolase [Eubacterium sp.]